MTFFNFNCSKTDCISFFEKDAFESAFISWNMQGYMIWEATLLKIRTLAFPAKKVSGP